MKIPKETKRHCPYCKKHTLHKVLQSKRKTRGTAHPLSAGSKMRLKKRGRTSGYGGKGKFSKPAIAKWKQSGKKVSKKSDFRYQCAQCKKQHVQKKGVRAKKIEYKG